MATQPAQPIESSHAAVTTTTTTTTVDSLNDDNIEDILLRLPSPASLARAALSSSRWRRVASSPDFLRRFREHHPSPPVLGLFVAQADHGQLPVFHPSAFVRSDPDLAAAARGGDFLLTRLEHDPRWLLRDCRNGHLLLSRPKFLSVYDPVSQLHYAVRRPLAGKYIADCLLGGHGEDGAASFCVVSVQRDGQRLRALEYHRSGTPNWRCHPWVEVDNIDVTTLGPAMPAPAAGLIVWSCDNKSFILLDRSTTAFSAVPLPTTLVILSTEQPEPQPVYAIGDTEAGECCLVTNVGKTTVQVWLLKKICDGNRWELEKQRQMSELVELNLHFFSPRVCMVSAGLALVYCIGSKYSHFLIDLKDLSVKDRFRCPCSWAYPFQITWPPAGLPATSTCQTSTIQTYARGDTIKQQETASSSRKRKGNDDEMSISGKETTMEPASISIASFENKPSEMKFRCEIGPPS